MVLLLAAAMAAPPAAANPRVRLETSKGTIVIELDQAKAPITVGNFLEYVKSGFYDGTIFHRVIPGFMIQGGGFTADMQQKPTREPIVNESANGLVNKRGTIAMARTAGPELGDCPVLHQPQGQRLPRQGQRAGRGTATACSARSSRGWAWSTRSPRSRPAPSGRYERRAAAAGRDQEGERGRGAGAAAK